MPAYILIGDHQSQDDFISSYKTKNSIRDLDTTIYIEKILIENARGLIKSLQRKSSTQRLFLIKNGLTLEAQNSLLKNIEELESYNAIFFCTRSVNELLPTVQSRCFIVNLTKSTYDNENISGFIADYLYNKLSLWELIEKIDELKSGNTLPAIQSSLRQIFLEKESSEKKKAFFFCKNLLRVSPLIKNNNINFRIALEKVFFLNP